MIVDIHSSHAGCLNGTDLAEYEHGQGADWHRHLGALMGTAHQCRRAKY